MTFASGVAESVAFSRRDGRAFIPPSRHRPDHESVTMPPHGGAGSSAREAETALLAAARRGTAEQTLVCLARVLETDGADVDARGPGDVTALHAASVRGDPTVAARLVDAGASLVARDGESGWSPLHRAFHHGSLRVAAALLEAGASLSAPLDHAGRTPVDVLSARLLSRRRRLRATRSSPTSPRPQFTSPSTRETVISNARPPPFPPCDLYCWGSGANYQLGNGARDDVVRPRRLDDLALAALPGGDPEENAGGGVVALAAAKFHSLAATADGSLFAWGHGRGGRLGVDDERTHSGDGAATRPARVPYFGPRAGRLVVAVSAGKHHSIALCDDGEVFSWGRNDDGRLGYATAPTTESSRETVHSSEPSLAPRYSLAPQHTPRKIGGALRGVRVVAVAASDAHSVVVSHAGDAYAFGRNDVGQLGIVDGFGETPNEKRETLGPRRVEQLRPRRVVAASASERHTVVLTADGECVVFGHGAWSSRRANVAGGLATARGKSDARDPVRLHRGEGDGARVVAIAAGAAHSLALTADGTTVAWPSELGGEARCAPVRGVRGAATAVAAGKSRCVVVTELGDAYAWEAERLSTRGAVDLGVGTGSTAVGADGWNERTVASSPTSSLSSSLSSSLPSSSLPSSSLSSQSLRRRSTSEPFRSPLARRVDGMKGVAFVAVGEKHTLAAQFARRPTRMRVDGAIGDAFVADDAGRLDEGRLDERLDEWAAAADAFAQNASDDDEVFALDDACRSDSDEDAYDTDAGSGSRRRVAAVPSLRDVAGAVVAERVCDARNATDLASLADHLGARALGSYCREVAVDNLDAALAARGAEHLVECDPRVLVDLERAIRVDFDDEFRDEFKDVFGDEATTPNVAMDGSRERSRERRSAAELAARVRDARTDHEDRSAAALGQAPNAASNARETSRTRTKPKANVSSPREVLGRAGTVAGGPSSPSRSSTSASGASWLTARVDSVAGGSESSSPKSLPPTSSRPLQSRAKIGSRRAEEAAAARSARGGLSLFLSGALEASFSRGRGGSRAGDEDADDADDGGSGRETRNPTTANPPPRRWNLSGAGEDDAASSPLALRDIQSRQAREAAEAAAAAAGWAATASRGATGDASKSIAASSSPRTSKGGAVELSLGALMRAPRGNVGYGGRGARGGASPPEPSAWGLDQRADATGTPPARSPAAAKSPSLMDIAREEEARASRAARAARVSGWYVPDRVEPATGLRAILAEEADAEAAEAAEAAEVEAAIAAVAAMEAEETRAKAEEARARAKARAKAKAKNVRIEAGASADARRDAKAETNVSGETKAPRRQPSARAADAPRRARGAEKTPASESKRSSTCRGSTRGEGGDENARASARRDGAGRRRADRGSGDSNRPSEGSGIVPTRPRAVSSR